MFGNQAFVVFEDSYFFALSKEKYDFHNELFYYILDLVSKMYYHIAVESNDLILTGKEHYMSTEKEYLETYDKNEYDRPSVAVDLLVFTIVDDRLKIVLIEREEHPFKNMLSLPGVFVGIDETLDAAVERGIAEETGLRDMYFEQLYTWGEVERDPRMRIISVSYLSLAHIGKINLAAGKRTISAGLYDVDELLGADKQLAFDHKKIIAYGRERIKNKVDYTKIAFEFLPEEFTLPELQKVYEILLGKPLYKAGFRRRVQPMIEETDRMTSGDAHRPSKYYRLKEE